VTDGSGIWAVVPVKEFYAAKGRLAGAYAPELRRALARAMLEDVLSALAVVSGLAGIRLATLDPEAAELGRAFGAETGMESAGEGLNEAVTAAARALALRGARGMLVIPGDVPNITADEVTRLMAAHGEGRAFTLVPARDGRGSNAVLATPPDAVAFAFGPESCRAHVAGARRAGIEPAVLHLPGIGLDLDTVEDVRRFAARPAPGRTRNLLEAEGLVPVST